MKENVYTIEEVLNAQGVYVGPPVGKSMLPMLKDRADTVVIRPKKERLAPLDVALYRRGDGYLLHRVIAQLEDGYLIRGDNCYYDETVAETDVLGVLSEFYHDGKHVLCTDKKYLRYAKRRVKNYNRRRFCLRMRQGAGKIFRKIIGAFKKKDKNK